MKKHERFESNRPRIWRNSGGCLYAQRCGSGGHGNGASHEVLSVAEKTSIKGFLFCGFYMYIDIYIYLYYIYIYIYLFI